MKVPVSLKCIVLDLTSNEYKDKVYHQAQVYFPESHETGSLGISDDLASQIKPDFSKVVSFKAEYNDKFGKLNLKGLDNGK